MAAIPVALFAPVKICSFQETRVFEIFTSCFKEFKFLGLPSSDHTISTPFGSKKMKVQQFVEIYGYIPTVSSDANGEAVPCSIQMICCIPAPPLIRKIIR